MTHDLSESQNNFPDSTIDFNYFNFLIKGQMMMPRAFSRLFWGQLPKMRSENIILIVASHSLKQFGTACFLFFLCIFSLSF